MLKDKIGQIQQRILKATQHRPANSGDVTLVAVTKTFPAAMAREAISLGLRDIGESRIQEAQSKFEELGAGLAGVKKHLIGHLQTNKAKKAVELFDLIQSLDSEHLAAEIDRQAARMNKIQDCLVEVKVSDEATKYGFSPVEVTAFVEKAAERFRHIRVLGLMAMAPYFEDTGSARPYFKQAREIFETVRSSGKHPRFDILSMGMSHDFEAAVEEGATMVRVGTAIFGER